MWLFCIKCDFPIQNIAEKIKKLRKWLQPSPLSPTILSYIVLRQAQSVFDTELWFDLVKNTFEGGKSSRKVQARENYVQRLVGLGYIALTLD